MDQCSFSTEPTFGKSISLFLGRSQPNGDFIWFDPIKTVHDTVEAIRYREKRSAPPIAGQDQSETFASSIDTISDHRTGMATASTSTVVDLTFDWGDKECIEDSPPSAKHICRSDNPCGSRQHPPAPAGRSTSHPISAISSTPPLPLLTKVQEIDISSQTPWLVSTQPPKHLSNDPVDLLLEEYVPSLQLFFHLVIGKTTESFNGTPTDLARQFWNLVEAHCVRREYARRTSPASWVEHNHNSVGRDEGDTSRSATGLWVFCLPICVNQPVLTPFGGIILLQPLLARESRA